MTTSYQILITLNDVQPKIWRRLLVPSDVPLSDLHNIIQTTMGWTNSHLHQFIKDKKFYEPPAPADMGLDSWGITYTGMTLDQFLTQENDTMDYEYDFGDGWHHEIKLEKIKEIEDEDKLKELPTCIDGENACPPEDCGGPWGYQEMLKALKNPDHSEHDEYKEWIGEEFDPHHFDKEEVNKWLQKDNYGVLRL